MKKFITFFAFIATASATTFIPSLDTNCYFLLAPESECSYPGGPIDLSGENIVAAKINFDVEPIIFYEQEDCLGDSVTVTSSQSCFQFPFVPQCAKILCY